MTWATSTVTAGVDVVEKQRGTSVRSERRGGGGVEEGGRSCVLIHATRHVCGPDSACIPGLRNSRCIARLRARGTTAAESARNTCVARRFPIYASLAGLRSVSCTAIDCAPKGGESRAGGSARVGGAGGGAVTGGNRGRERSAALKEGTREHGRRETGATQR